MSFMLLFRDLIRLFACYNDGIINLLEKYFDMNKKHARDALDLYKKFLVRMDRVGEFLKVAEVCDSLKRINTLYLFVKFLLLECGRWSLACFGRLAIGLVFGIRGVVFGIVIVVEVVVVIVSGWKKTVMKK